MAKVLARVVNIDCEVMVCAGWCALYSVLNFAGQTLDS